ncbi:MAG: hypothetical protein QXH78_02380 [Desulfurococcaceae archaeon]
MNSNSRCIYVSSKYAGYHILVFSSKLSGLEILIHDCTKPDGTGS